MCTYVLCSGCLSHIKGSALVNLKYIWSDVTPLGPYFQAMISFQAQNIGPVYRAFIIGAPVTRYHHVPPLVYMI